MTWRLEGRLFVVVHTSAEPARDEWQDQMRDFRALRDMASPCVLVRSYGGAPDGAQRKLLVAATERKPVPIAVMTDSLLARTVGTAVSWFNPQVRMFDVPDVEGASAFLGLSAAEIERARHLLRVLEGELAIAPKPSAARPA